jgi:ubiquinone/menaquinone biosynthesis C-methylase UbiE
MRETDFKTKESFNEKDVIAFYDDYAQNWNERFGKKESTSHFIERRWRSFEKALIYSGCNKSTALELGVGSGVYIEQCSKIFDKIVAVDGSNKMLSQLKIRLKKLNVENVRAVVANVIDLSKVPDSSVDCVYFFGLIEHIVNMEQFVSEIKRVLKSKGVVIGVTPNARSPWYKLRSIFRGTGKHCSTDRYYSSRDLKSIFYEEYFFNLSMNHWGLVPAGFDGWGVKFLKWLEPFAERTPAKYLLGGITFSFRLIK